MLPTVKAVLKRGALVAAANWPVIVVQAVADSLFKLLIAAPLVGGIVLVTLAVGAEPLALLSLEWRELVPTLVALLVSRPFVLAPFLAAVAVTAIGGSLFVFLVKGGTMGVLVRAEREAGPIEQPPLRFDVVASASRFSIELFVDSARALFPSYARLGAVLLTAYAVAGALYLTAVFAAGPGRGWAVTALVTAGFVAAITGINLLYLLVQVVIAAEGCGVSAAAGRVTRFLRRERRPVLAVFAVVLAIVVFATGASVLAAGLLGLIAFVPVFGLAVLPLQLMAWLLRGLVFQYIGMASIGAYVRLYRLPAAGSLSAPMSAALHPSALHD